MRHRAFLLIVLALGAAHAEDLAVFLSRGKQARAGGGSCASCTLATVTWLPPAPAEPTVRPSNPSSGTGGLG